jgi:hypothetical protein
MGSSTTTGTRTRVYVVQRRLLAVLLNVLSWQGPRLPAVRWSVRGASRALALVLTTAAAGVLGKAAVLAGAHLGLTFLAAALWLGLSTCGVLLVSLLLWRYQVSARLRGRQRLRRAYPSRLAR